MGRDRQRTGAYRRHRTISPRSAPVVRDAWGRRRPVRSRVRVQPAHGCKQGRGLVAACLTPWFLRQIGMTATARMLARPGRDLHPDPRLRLQKRPGTVLTSYSNPPSRLGWPCRLIT